MPKLSHLRVRLYTKVNLEMAKLITDQLNDF